MPHALITTVQEESNELKLLQSYHLKVLQGLQVGFLAILLFKIVQGLQMGLLTSRLSESMLSSSVITST